MRGFWAVGRWGAELFGEKLLFWGIRGEFVVRACFREEISRGAKNNLNSRSCHVVVLLVVVSFWLSVLFSSVLLLLLLLLLLRAGLRHVVGRGERVEK